MNSRAWCKDLGLKQILAYLQLLRNVVVTFFFFLTSRFLPYFLLFGVGNVTRRLPVKGKFKDLPRLGHEGAESAIKWPCSAACAEGNLQALAARSADQKKYVPTASARCWNCEPRCSYQPPLEFPGDDSESRVLPNGEKKRNCEPETISSNVLMVGSPCVQEKAFLC